MNRVYNVHQPSRFQILPELTTPISEVDVTQFLFKPIKEDIQQILVVLQKSGTGEGFILFRPMACYRKYILGGWLIG
jgi:hypothetical protein